MAEVWAHAPAKDGTLLFLLALADQADDETRCAWPGSKVLSQRARCSKRTAYRHAERLEKAGIVRRLEGDERPVRYDKSAGRETTCWQIQPRDQWRPVDDDDEQDEGCQPVTGVIRDTPGVTPLTRRGVRRVTSGVSPVSIEPSTNNQQRTPKKNRRAAPDADLPVVGGLPPEPEEQAPRRPQVVRKAGSRNPALLAQVFEQRASLAGGGDGRAITLGSALSRQMKSWRDDKGIDLDDVAAAIDIFFASDHYKRPGIAFWKTFVSNIDALLAKVADAEPIDHVAATAVVTTDFDTAEAYEAHMARQLGLVG